MGKVAKVYLDDVGDKLAKENTKFYVEKEGKGMGYSYNVVYRNRKLTIWLFSAYLTLVSVLVFSYFKYFEDCLKFLLTLLLVLLSSACGLLRGHALCQKILVGKPIHLHCFLLWK